MELPLNYYVSLARKKKFYRLRTARAWKMLENNDVEKQQDVARARVCMCVCVCKSVAAP